MGMGGSGNGNGFMGMGGNGNRNSPSRTPLLESYVDRVLMFAVCSCGCCGREHDLIRR